MIKGVKMEAPDFHRETFYSDHSHTPFTVNLWIPIKNVNEKKPGIMFIDAPGGNGKSFLVNKILT